MLSTHECLAIETARLAELAVGSVSERFSVRGIARHTARSCYMNKSHCPETCRCDAAENELLMGGCILGMKALESDRCFRRGHPNDQDKMGREMQQENLRRRVCTNPGE